ncbi:MAG: TIM barrel protein, partial [Candidatus Brocadiia bacterium]
AFGAGYDLRRPEQVERMAADLRRAGALESVALMHVNDSRDAPGSRRDRHEHIGKGRIGNAGLRNVLTHRAFAGLPLILETPWETLEADRRNLRAVVQLVEGGA